MNNNQNYQVVDLRQPFSSNAIGAPPLFINVNVTRDTMYTESGPSMPNVKLEHYVLLSALPEELQRKIVDVINATRAGM